MLPSLNVWFSRWGPIKKNCKFQSWSSETKFINLAKIPTDIQLLLQGTRFIVTHGKLTKLFSLYGFIVGTSVSAKLVFLFHFEMDHMPSWYFETRQSALSKRSHDDLLLASFDLCSKMKLIRTTDLFFFIRWSSLVSIWQVAGPCQIVARCGIQRRSNSLRSAWSRANWRAHWRYSAHFEWALQANWRVVGRHEVIVTSEQSLLFAS